MIWSWRNYGWPSQNPTSKYDSTTLSVLEPVTAERSLQKPSLFNQSIIINTVTFDKLLKIFLQFVNVHVRLPFTKTESGEKKQTEKHKSWNRIWSFIWTPKYPQIIRLRFIMEGWGRGGGWLWGLLGFLRLFSTRVSRKKNVGRLDFGGRGLKSSLAPLKLTTCISWLSCDANSDEIA